VVGKAGFEPATSASRTLRAAKLRHFPRNRCPSIRDAEGHPGEASGRVSEHLSGLYGTSGTLGRTGRVSQHLSGLYGTSGTLAPRRNLFTSCS
jgi:hypothetical protein